MRRMVVGMVAVLATACISAPSPKEPDEAHRVPVNRVVPPELAAEKPAKKAAQKERGDGGEVEWR
jgi:hypothetical protein